MPMRKLQDIFEHCREIADNPRKQLNNILADGKKVVGVLPYFCPEELVLAAGMVPFGLWGAEIQTSESKRYYPAFVCSILHTVLELGIKGTLNDLSGIMIPKTCDSLKCMPANWKYGVGASVPIVNVPMAQNRYMNAGIEFTAAKYRRICSELAAIAGNEISDDDIRDAIAVYNKNRAALRGFVKAAGEHPEMVTPADRCAAIKCGYFMPRAEHTALIEEATDALDTLVSEKWDGLRIVTTGIIADSSSFLEILAENKMAVIDDQVTHESVSFRADTPETEDPLVGMAQRIALIEGSSVLYDPGKNRAKSLVKLAQAAKADGVLFILTKFCDPEEFDYVPVNQALSEARIPFLEVEVDQQMTNYEQARSAIEAFAEILRG